MKKNVYRAITLFLLILVFVTCHKDEGGITICGTRCSTSTPWTVESLDMGLPCFANQTACAVWAAGHGYSDKPCVRCD